MSTMVYFDTLQYLKTLEKAGFSEVQAEAFVKVQQESLNECLDTTLATKSDMAELKSEMKQMEFKLNLHGWMLGFISTGITAIVVKSFF